MLVGLDAIHDAWLLLREGLHLYDKASVDVISQELLDKLGIRAKTCVIDLCQKPLPGPPDYSSLVTSSGDKSAVNVKRVYTGGLRRTSTTSQCADDTCVGFGNFTRRVWSCHAHVCWIGHTHNCIPVVLDFVFTINLMKPQKNIKSSLSTCAGSRSWPVAWKSFRQLGYKGHAAAWNYRRYTMSRARPSAPRNLQVPNLAALGRRRSPKYQALF